MRKLGMAFVAGATMLVSAGAGAQLRAATDIPPGFMPPAGMCRVWIDGVAPGRQPAPTDCGTARASLRRDSRLVYGPALRTGSRDQRAGGVWSGDGRYDRDRYDRLSDKQRRELRKERRKREKEREKEWRKAHKKHHDEYGRRHGDDDDDDDEDDDHDGDRRDRDHDRRDRDRGRYGTSDGTWGRPGSTTGPILGGGVGTGTGRGQCVDANHDGICDTQSGGSRVRIP